MVLAATDCHLEDNLRVAAVKAHLVGISRLGGAVSSLDMEALAFKRVQLTGVTFRTRAIHEKDAPIAVKRWWLGGRLELGGCGSESRVRLRGSCGLRRGGSWGGLRCAVTLRVMRCRIPGPFSLCWRSGHSGDGRSGDWRSGSSSRARAAASQSR